MLWRLYMVFMKARLCDSVSITLSITVNILYWLSISIISKKVIILSAFDLLKKEEIRSRMKAWQRVWKLSRLE